MFFHLECAGADVTGYTLNVDWNFQGFILGMTVFDSTCSPFVLNFNSGEWPNPGPFCDGGVIFTVTS